MGRLIHVRALVALVALSAAAPAIAAGQEAVGRLSLQGAVGTHVTDGGDNQSLAVGFSPHERWEILAAAERSHWPTRVTRYGATRGGTTTFFSGEVRFIPFRVGRISPYAIASAGRGISRPNVNEIFPDRVTNDTWLVLFAGGGVRVDMSRRLSAFVDVRAGIQGERDVIRLLVPLRGGFAWRF